MGGLDLARWRRLAVGGRAARAWAPDGMFDVATLRLPRGKALLDMQLHAVAARLKPGATLWVYGANDEGIRSATKRLMPLFEGGETIDTRRHCRVLQARRTEAPARGEIGDWEEVLDLGEAVGEVASWPGLFAHGRLDDGSAMLIDALSDDDIYGTMLDYGCGAGALSLAALRRNPTCRITGVDIDALALHAARRNVPDMKLHLGDGIAALPKGVRFDRILSNPPFHTGKDEDFGALTGLIEAAPNLLKVGGRLIMVTQRTAGGAKALRARLPKLTVIAEDRRFQVFRAMV